MVKLMRKRWIWWLACIVWLAMIFRQSSMAAPESRAESNEVLLIFGQWLPFLTVRLVRKLAHFGEFAILGFFLSQCLRSNPIFPAFAGLVCALTDETIQLFVQGRSGQVSDVWVDFSGIAVAVAVCFLFRVIRRMRRKRALGNA